MTSSDGDTLAPLDISPPDSLGARMLPFAVIVLAVLASHGLSLWHGLSFDDHTHRQALRHAGWSLAELVQAGRVGEANGLVQFWWGGEPTFWQPFRPFCFLIMKIEYTVVGWSPFGMHAFALGWHILSACLVRALAVFVLGSRRWALAAAVLFAMHPGHGTTSEWIASKNEVMATALILVSLLAYGRWARWPTPMLSKDRCAVDSGRRDRGSMLWLAGSLLAYSAALGCRETAILLPVLVVLFDAVAGRRDWPRRIGVYVVLAAISLAYLWLRYRSLGGLPMPGLPYMYPPSEPGFLRFVFDKLLFYQLGLFLYVPALQLGSFEFLARHPMLFYGLSGGLLTGIAIIVARTIGLRPPVLALLAWSFLCTAPVLAVFAGSHHLYLPSVGSVILSMAVLQYFGRPGRSERAARILHAVVVAGFVGYLLGSVITAVQFQRVARMEQEWTEGMVAAIGPVRNGDRVFVIDFPVLGSFAGPAIAEAKGCDDLTLWALSVRSSTSARARYEFAGSSTLRVWIPPHEGPDKAGDEGVPYIAVMAERQIELLIPAAVGPGPYDAGTVIALDGWTATYVGRSSDGWAEWRFDFDEPLASPRNHFCAWSQEYRFTRIESGAVVGGEGSSAQRNAPANG